MSARDILRARNFRHRAAQALRDAQLQQALANVPVGFVAKRGKAMRRLPEFARLCAQVAAMRRAALADVEALLARFVERAEAAGAVVHLARNGTEACRIIGDVLQERGAELVVKGKSMTAEEIGLNAALEKHGVQVVETDLGEYIIQLRREPPSHIVAPAIHLRIADIAGDFRQHHAGLAAPARSPSRPPGLSSKWPGGEACRHSEQDDLLLPLHRPLDTAEKLAAEARAVLREKFLAAEAGITGANALIADTGQIMLITNEGNGDLCATNPRLHVVVAGVEKLVPDMAAALDVARVLPRSATGQEITVYATFHGGARRVNEPDGPEEMHIVLLADSRRKLLRGPFAEMLACIRCGACLNHCPVYQLTGGHAYGRVYSGPMGIVLGRAVFGLRGTAESAAADTTSPCKEEVGASASGGGRALREQCPQMHGKGKVSAAWRLPTPSLSLPLSGGGEVDGTSMMLADGVEEACTLCNRCAEVCPAGIDLPGLIRRWRAEKVRQGGGGWLAGWAQRLHAALAARPALYRRAAGAGARMLRLLRRHPGLARRLPGLREWMQGRTLPDVAGETFLEEMAGKVFEAEGGCGPLPPSPALSHKGGGRAGGSPGRVIPARARVEGAAALEMFVEQAEAAGAVVHRLASLDDVPEMVARVMRQMELEPRVFDMCGLPEGAWRAAGLETGYFLDLNAQPAALMPARAAAAETGTLVFSSTEMPVRALLLPEVLFAVLPTQAVFGGYEAALAHALGVESIDDLPTADKLPRSLMLITGPSRTADVEQTLVIGAHGPKAVHVLLVEGEA